MAIDHDQPDPRVVKQLVATYEASADRLRKLVLSPAGASEHAREWTQARASALLAQVQAEIDRLKKEAVQWTGEALSKATQKGIKVADVQARQAGVVPRGDAAQRGSFHLVDRSAVEILAKDTVGDLLKAADAMGKTADIALRKMAAAGVSTADLNAILAGGIIEGQPERAIRELRDALKAVHGNRVVIQDKNGNPMEFKTSYYAKMVAVTKTREAVAKARHGRLQQSGIDLVVVVGKRSTNFCTAYLDKVFSISGGSKKYPALADLPGGGPPFHPNCSKSTAPFVEELADPEEVEAGLPDPDTQPMLARQADGSKVSTTELQRRFQASRGLQSAEARAAKLRTDAGRKFITHAKDDARFQEHLVRKLGVPKVDFAGRPEIGEAVAKGLQQVAAAGGMMPKSVRVTIEPFRQDPTRNRVATTKDGHVLLNPMWPGWRNLDKAMEALFRKGVVSSMDRRHAIFHESGHVNMGTNLAGRRFASDADKAIASKVSRRAEFDQDEFMAEFRAARMAGRRFGKDVMALYERLNQP